MTNQPRFRGQFAQIRPSGAGFTIGDQQDMAFETAKSDGVYTINGHRFRVRAGGRIPAGAAFATEGQAAKESAKDEPKWFQEIVAKAAETGETVLPREGNETEKAYRERVAAHGPAENTNAQGPQETS